MTSTATAWSRRWTSNWWQGDWYRTDYDPDYDVNCDGVVDILDIQVTRRPGRPSCVAAHEPGWFWFGLQRAITLSQDPAVQRARVRFPNSLPVP